MSESVSQSVSRSVSHSASQSVVSQSLGLSDILLVIQLLVSQSVGQWVSESVSQPVSQSVSQSFCQSVSSQSVSQPAVSQSVTQFIYLFIYLFIHLFIYLFILLWLFWPYLCRYNQAVAMTRFYKRPILLIEFDPNKSFSLQVRSRQGTTNVLKCTVFSEWARIKSSLLCLIKEVWFSAAEEQKKWKTFFSHTAGNVGSSVWGVLGHMTFQSSVVFAAIRHCLTSPAHRLHGRLGMAPSCVWEKVLKEAGTFLPMTILMFNADICRNPVCF